jgi:SAM-dependent methyltransferase
MTIERNEMTTPGRTGSGSPWDYIQDWDVELVGPEIRDPLAVGRWARAFALAGGLGYMWNELARPVSEIVYGLLELRPGDKVLIIGEAVGPAGWEEDMRAIVGPSGAVDVVEILPQGRRAVAEQWRGRNGMLGCWRWDYTEAMESESYDCVAIMQSTQHCDDWSDVGPEVLRVMKPGRRIVFAEMVLGGPRFDQRVGADLHVRQWYEKIMGRMRDSLDGVVSFYSGEDLLRAMGDFLESPQTLEWKGIEMFWGRKPRLPAIEQTSTWTSSSSGPDRQVRPQRSPSALTASTSSCSPTTGGCPTIRVPTSPTSGPRGAPAARHPATG